MRFETATAVDQAMDLFWSQGYAATTPQQLADAMEIGKGSLYNTFESKRALFVRALRLYSEQRVQYLEHLLSPPGLIGPRLREAVTVLSGVGEHRRGCVMVNAVAELGHDDEEVQRIGHALFDQIESIFGRAVARGQESGELDANRNAQAIARQLLSSSIGLSVLVKTGEPTDRSTEVITSVVDGLRTHIA
jgi:TetR/AcrR family transcriptional repressor of nem operon